MPRYDEYKDQIDYLYEDADIYDGWSIAVLKDGRQVNRWQQYATDEGLYRHRFEKTQEIIDSGRLSVDELSHAVDNT